MTKEINKAIKKLEEAVSYYKKGLYDKANNAKDVADNILEAVNFGRAKDEILYTESINFGIINHVAMANMNDGSSVISEALGKKMKRYSKMIRENKNLKAQYNIYQRLQECNNPENYGEYADMVMSTYCPEIDVDTMEDDNYAFLNSLRGNEEYDECVDVPEQDLDLYAIIGNMITSFLDPSRYEEYIDSRNQAKELISTPVNSHFDDVTDNRKDLTADEMDLIYNVSNLDGVELEIEYENKRESAKAWAIEKLTNSETEEEMLGWGNILKNIEKFTFSEETALEDIAKFEELTKTL